MTSCCAPSQARENDWQMNKRILACAVLAAIAGCKKKEEPKPAPAPGPEAKAVTATTPKPATPETPGGDLKLIDRGAYLVKAGACMVCHTAMGPKGPDLEHAFAGGLEMPDPAGTWRTPNITQDKGTGIGNWTDDQIAAAIREGVRPDGGGLYAIMPYMNYNHLSDEDTKAIVAYLRTVKPVERTIAPNKDLKMPKGPGPKPANQADVPADQLKHGEYFASVMLCSHCHWTPGKNLAPAGPDKMFSGGLPFEIPMLGSGTLYAKNISSDTETGIGKWSEDQIYTTIKTMVRPDGKPIMGPMLFLQSSWSQLEDKDLKAVAAYIKHLPPVSNKVPDSTFKPAGPPPGAPGGAPPAPGGAGDKPMPAGGAGDKPAAPGKAG